MSKAFPPGLGYAGFYDNLAYLNQYTNPQAFSGNYADAYNSSGVPIRYLSDGSQWNAVVTQGQDGSLLGSDGNNIAYQFPKRTTPLRVATFGDSTANTNSSLTNQATITTTFATHAGLSLAPERWQLPTYYPQAYLVGNGGVSGDNTTQMLARDTAAITTSRKAIADIIDLDPDVVLLRGGSINNVLSITVATYNTVVAKDYSEHVQIISRLLEAGITVIDEGIYGTDGTGATDPVTCYAAITQLNAMFAAYAAVTPNLYFINPQGFLSNNGKFYPGIPQEDGLGRHPGLNAQNLIAQREAALCVRVFGPSTENRYQGPNVLKNAAVVAANMNNNSLFASYNPGGGFGGFPTGFTAGNLNGTRQNGRVQVVNGKNYYIFQNIANAPGSQMSFFMPIDIANFVPAIGDTWGVEYDLIIGGVTKNTPPRLTGFANSFDFTSTNNIPITYNMASVSSIPVPGYFAIKVVFQPFVFPADTGALSAVEIFSRIQTDDMVTYEFGISMPRLVKLGLPVTTI